MSSVSIDMLAAFVKVAELLSVSAAAGQLGVSKGVVSKRVAQLEQATGSTLFSRSTRRVALTPAGEVYLDHARSALQALTTADERLRHLRSDLNGLIRVTAPVSWGLRVLAKVVPAFLAEHPGIEIELRLEDRLMDIAYERVDIALRMSATASQELSATPVAQLAWVICATPAYLAQAGTPQEPQDLRRHPCMSYWRETSDETWQLDAADRSASVKVHGRLRANNPESVAEAVLAGLGIALLPVYVCDAELADGRLVALLPGWTPVTKFGQQITALVPPDRLRLTRQLVFLHFLRDRLGATAFPAGSTAVRGD